MSLPKFISQDRALSLLQTTWAKTIDPIAANPISSSIILNGVVVASGNNTINHKLGRKLQGWIVIGNSAFVQLYDKQSSNKTPDLTLVLNSNGAATLNLLVF